jgi:lysophospholipase
MDLPAAPYFDDIARGPAGAAAYWLRAADGVRSRIAVWPGTNARGTVLMFPGRTEYVEKYSDAAQAFAARGFASVAIDWRGQGLADRAHVDRRLGHVRSFAEYQRDVTAMMRGLNRLNLPKPFFLFAHSMGGAIALRALLTGLPVRAVAFSAPMWGLMLAPHTRAAAWIGAHLAVWTGQGACYSPGTDAAAEPASMAFADNPLTNDADMFAWMQAQTTAHPELLLGGPSLSWLRAALREMHALAREGAPALPCACWLGTDEQIVDPDPIHIRMTGWTGGTLHQIPGVRHEVAMEGPQIRGRLFDDCVRLFDSAR